ncbi:hypothetical protein HPP92_020552 [Vanilla planifolia]|uniref:Uncharacterized protein n=1 Tax=Vanilla planifolia TaxID=51239 RepID=A0A835UK74_VANPL|nr:hypothetical protein HPP92_020552 [Vanilla planifolia]
MASTSELHKERDVGAAEVLGLESDGNPPQFIWHRTTNLWARGQQSWTNLLADEARKTEAGSLVSARAGRALDPILRAARMRWDCSHKLTIKKSLPGVHAPSSNSMIVKHI